MKWVTTDLSDESENRLGNWTSAECIFTEFDVLESLPSLQLVNF